MTDQLKYTSRKVSAGHPVPDDDHGVDRMLARRKWLVSEGERVQSVAEAAIADIETWQREAMEPLAEEIHHIDALAEIWHRRQVREGRPSKIKLPHGTLVLKPAGAGKAVVSDPEALLAWAEANTPEAVTEKPAPLPTVNLTTLKGLCRPAGKAEPNSSVPLVGPNGEKVPGVIIVVPERNWEIKHA